MFLFRVAAMTKRILVIKQNHPAPLEEFLKPSGILDWMTHDITEPVSKIDILQQFIPHLKNGTVHELPHKYILCLCMPAEHEDTMHPGMPPIKERWADLHCMWHALYQPSDRVVKQAEEQFQQLKIKPDQPYTSIHLRLGGMVGESGNMHWENSLPLVLSAARCAKHLGLQHGYDGPVVMVTDHAVVRKFVAAGFVKNVTAYKTIPHHFDSAHGAIEGAVTTVSDLVVLAHAKCQVMGQRGFSNMAHWWAGDICFKDAHGCPGEHWTANNKLRKLMAAARQRPEELAPQPHTRRTAGPAAASRVVQLAEPMPAAARLVDQLSTQPGVGACLSRLQSWWDEQVALGADAASVANPPDCGRQASQHVSTILAAMAS
ncbi:hypothetical protein QJQ45_021586 [Haematococcus lacustris]|nr:hypothetical protein QJQ45_021586 [Haematococcus lacustris]